MPTGPVLSRVRSNFRIGVAEQVAQRECSCPQRRVTARAVMGPDAAAWQDRQPTEDERIEEGALAGRRFPDHRDAGSPS